MAYNKNAWLEKYEVKKPDYDLSEREYVGMKDAVYETTRYIKNGDLWEAKQNSDERKAGERARIMFVGDITCFEKQFQEAKQGNDYDFRYELEQMRPIFAQADLVIGNLETMVFPDAPYRTEKYVSEQNFHCNAPLEFLDAVRSAGIDVVTNANNHDLDTGAIGIGETIDYVEQFGLIQTGTFNRDKKRYELICVNGFKVAIVAFATEHNNKKVNLTEEGADFLLNDYSTEKARKIIKEARDDGAQLVFVCIHWGEEHKTAHKRKQVEIAQELVRLGYDCIIGSHPHVLQPYRELRFNGKLVPTFYSMGNFLSHNVTGPKSRSVIACIDLVRNGDAISLETSYIPIHTSKDYGEKKFVVLPLTETSLDARNIKRRNQIKEIMGDSISANTTIRYSECAEKVRLPEPSTADKKPDLSKAAKDPVPYDDGKFTYMIHGDRAVCTGISPNSTSQSYSVPNKILDLPVSEIQTGAFADNQVLKKINFRKNQRIISEKACKNCINLEGFQLSSTVKEIKEEAFAGCTNLSCAVLKGALRKIGENAFKDCVNLRSVKVLPCVSEIAPNAFDGCNKAVFYCEQNSYAETYAKTHGFPVVYMKLSEE